MQVQIKIDGSFTSIPANCVSAFAGAKSITLEIAGQLEEISIDSQAFVIDSKTSISQLVLAYIDFPTIPIIDWSHIDRLKFYECQISTVYDNAFSGFAGTYLELDDSEVQTVQPNAFAGVGTLNDLSMNGNFLNSISTAFKTVKTSELDMSGNGIYQILDFAFCECNQPDACPNKDLTTLYFDLNPMSYISDNAFANLPNLIYLEFDQGDLTEVPTNAIKGLSNLVSIDLSKNEIKIIEANAFAGCSSMYYIYLDYNPIMTIEPGAFNGFDQMISLPLANLPLKSVDLLITYGITNLKDISFASFPQLSSVILSDYTKLPQSLQLVNMSHVPVSTISSDLQYWLSSSKLIKYLDISYNANITCDSSIKWMAPFVCCTPVQIFAKGTTCASSNQDLTVYLQSLQPTCS
jgi:Leucine-rich repeat (LRR) protein